MQSALYIVPTPLGNMGDMTYRAVEVLREATLIAAEDTRHSQVLLKHLGINPQHLISCHDHNEDNRAEQIISEVRNGGAVALISDAGTPLINDPGYRVVSKCIEAGLPVISLPGACALITALTVAGLPTDCFSFRGFMPARDSEMDRVCADLAVREETAVFYVSPHRLPRTAEILAAKIPGRRVALCREMTKVFESVYRMNTDDLPEFLSADADRCRGEFVLVIAGTGPVKPEADAQVTEALRQMLRFMPLKEAVRILCGLTGVPRSELYEAGQLMKDQGSDDS